MKKLICLALAVALMLTFSGCNGKQAEFEPVEGFESHSSWIYGTEFGISPEEYMQTDAHREMLTLAGYDNHGTNGNTPYYPDNYEQFEYGNLKDSAGENVAYYAQSEFIDGKLVAINFCLNKIGSEPTETKSRQKEIVRAYSTMAEEMGFVKQESFRNVRRPMILYNGYSLLDTRYDNRMNSLVCEWGAQGYKFEFNDNEKEYLEFDTSYLNMANKVTYYLSKDGTKALAIVPVDAHTQRVAVIIPGDDPYWERDETLKQYDPETEFDKISGYKKEWQSAPVYVTYYDIEAINDNMDIFRGNTKYLVNPCTVELLKEVEEIGVFELREKYKDVIDFYD